ncbi:MAG: heme NO-binding domain-containing protein [Fluviicoccus sp.]|uniref:heme NO-binding domain-containing protein n=1 Tax=Fluviicoccus sp. TaxID=2003552 RepID=UPI0027287633|nr:heme NO-binding domain-containing protein [Fluviicoccus sp.]MDO8332025.1 heme NO-binding domain-containing protein [Fluviicoccus sp.]
MYGLVNNLLSGTLRAQYGEDVWQSIAARLPFDATYFVSMKPYPDEWSYAMVGAACELTGDSAGDLLRVVGHRWVSENSAGEYKDLFTLNGPDIFTFLSNLNSMHAALGNQMPGLKPPSFMVNRENEQVIRVRYFSTRAGLAPLVTGLLEGLCDFFAEPATVSQTRLRVDERDYDEFRIERKA